jgi:NADPH:quinone reductase-like Zn-dependent oxidoreductase
VKAAVLIRHGAASTAFEIRALEDPLPRRGEVRIDVEFFGVNFADVLARLGFYPEAPSPPSVLGYEVVGWIDALGPECGVLKQGMRVVAFTRFGAYATKAVAPTSAVVPLPEAFDGAAATALATQFTTAYYAAEEMVRLQEGDRVLIHSAAGGLGTALVQIAKGHGCIVNGATGSPGKIDAIGRLGVDYPIAVTRAHFEQEFRAAAPGVKLDVIFDPLGGSFTRSGLRLLGSGGRIVCLGVSTMTGPRRNIFRSLGAIVSFGFPHPIMLMLQSKAIIGVNMLRIGEEKPLTLSRCLQESVRRGVAGEFRPVVGQIFPIDRLAEAHEAVEARATVGKIAVRW